MTLLDQTLRFVLKDPVEFLLLETSVILDHSLYSGSGKIEVREKFMRWGNGLSMLGFKL